MTPLLRDNDHLRHAGGLLVASVYTMAGCRVAWPLEPAAYDLLVDEGLGAVMTRVQVKTCTSRKDGAWTCWITRHEYAGTAGHMRRAKYPPGSLDVLAVVDGDLGVFLVPYALVAGQSTLALRAYERFRVASLTMPLRDRATVPV